VVEMLLMPLILYHEQIINLMTELSSHADAMVNGSVDQLEERIRAEEIMMAKEDDIEYTDEEIEKLVDARMQNNHLKISIEDKIGRIKGAM
tara:strand:- start:630 stop:902 length:273 start_codon:yes stop_codon:yes gene_type:complete